MADNQLKQIDSMTYVELRAELKRRGCSTSGNKKTLIDKLRDAMHQESKKNPSSMDSVENLQDEKLLTNSTLSIHNEKLEDSSYSTGTHDNETQASNDQSSTNGTSDGTTNIASIQQVLDTSINDNNVEVKSFVSKSIEDEQKNVEKLGTGGEESYPSSVGSTSAKSESIVKETPLSDEQQRSFQSNSNERQDKKTIKIDEESKSAVHAANDDVKKQNGIVKQPSSNQSVSADLQAANIEEQRTTTIDKPFKIIRPTEAAASQQKQNINRSQVPSSFTKGLHRSTNNKINLSFELLQTLLSDVSLLPTSVADEELDAWMSEQNIDNHNNNEQSINESVLEAHTINDLLADSKTIGDLADQKPHISRTVVMNTTINPSSLNNDSTIIKKQNPTTPNSPAFESKISIDRKLNTIVTDEPLRVKNVTANDGQLSQILYICGLTRPFSLLQLKSLLSRYGTLIDSQFWLNKIKSECLATYNTVEEAKYARESLDGCRWPSTNPKLLSIRFAQENEFQFSKTHDLSPDQMPTNKLSLSRTIQQDKLNEISLKQSDSSPIDAEESKTNKNSSEIREWDIPKLQEKVQNQSRTSEEKEFVKTDETPAKGLDDYFRKTKSKPSIYWLPLTEEQIIERLQAIEKRHAERQELRRREQDENDQKSNFKSHHRSSPRKEKRKHSSPSPQGNSKRR